MAKKKAAPPDSPVWKNRIVAYGTEDPEQLLANPQNWRIHPGYQQEALQGVLSEVGWVQDVIVNRTTGHVLDGHLRIMLSMRNNIKEVPVKYIELDPEEEALVLATLDPIAGMAQADKTLYASLLRDVSTGNAAVQSMLSDLAAEYGVFYQGDNTTVLTQPEGASPQAPIAHPVDLIFTWNRYSQTLPACCVAVSCGWHYGIQSGPKDNERRICPATEYEYGRKYTHKILFVDNDFKQYDHVWHRDFVAKHRPKYATVRDVMTQQQCSKAGIEYYSIEQILEWAEELQEFAEHVIVIPKYQCLDRIPEKFSVGYSIPTSHGGTPLPVEVFRGRNIHLLGGSLEAQWQYLQTFKEDVKSLDNNHLAKIAKFGRYYPGALTVSGSLKTDFQHELPRPLMFCMLLSFMAFAAQVGMLRLEEEEDDQQDDRE